MSAVQLKVKRMHPDAVLPTYAHEGDACFDLSVVGIEKTGHMTAAEIEMREDCPRTFRTGLAFEIPLGHVLLIFSRSGHGFKHNTRLSNVVGVIDSGYRNEVMIRLICDVRSGGGWLHEPPFIIKNGDRIAQAMLVPRPTVSLEWAEELSDSERGMGGFGSSGS